MKDIAIKIIGVLLMLPTQSALAYTAFAFLHPDGGGRAFFYTAQNFPSQAEADARALAICNQRMQSPTSQVPGRCEVDSRSQIHNQCVSITETEDTGTSDNAMLFYGTGSTAQAAEAAAQALAQTNLGGGGRVQLLFRCDADGNNCSNYRYTACDMTSAGAAPVDHCTTDQDFCRQNNINVSASSGGGGGGGSGAGIAIGAVAVVGLLAYSLSGMSDEPPTTSFVPVAEYADENGIRRWNVGSRFNWQMGDWAAHWKATKTSATDNSFSYGTGMEWTGAIFVAEFNSRGIGKESKLDFSLSADKEFGLWKLSPLYRLDYRKNEVGETLLHSLSAKLVWAVDKWTVTHSAGFSGDSLSAMSDNATAKILLRREF